MFRDRFWLSVLLTIPVLVWSEMVQEWLGYTAPTFPLSARIPAILGTVVFVYGGMPFLQGGVREVRDRQPGMMLLISLAIARRVRREPRVRVRRPRPRVLVGARAPDRRDAPRPLAGDEGARTGLRRARGARRAPAGRGRECCTATRRRTVPVVELRPGDLVLVRPGGRVPADGTIVDGDAAFDESMITGESKPVGHEPGDRVVAGTVATDGAVRVRVEAVGDDTTLAGIQRLVDGGAGVAVAGAGARRPRRRDPVLRRGRRGRAHVRGLERHRGRRARPSSAPSPCW